ncbi:hypothetical protein F3J44_27795 [Pantoea sp. Tr-811]|uniref:hypothetical protein n=1 Tax=unclassified Pantoea TaxID=2630326 RepID=UPI00141DF8A0|nr:MULTISPECIES: hypothetical protein [unclassified Pantoea]NIE74820.1 hypothetical protein [Pantoea sp. Ap-967]NIF30148.1 hypothetical protein [Pantoea sp. Tr-811]
MKYLLLTLGSFALTYYLVGLLIQGRLADLADGLRHQPDAPSPAEYLDAIRAHARKAHWQYTLAAGTVLAVLVCMVVSWFN